MAKPNCLKLNFELGEKIATLAPDKDGTDKVSGHGTRANSSLGKRCASPGVQTAGDSAGRSDCDQGETSANASIG